MTILRAPAGATSASFGEREYMVENGTIDVPVGAVADLKAHGYTDPEAPPPVDPADLKDTRVKIPRDIFVECLRLLGFMVPPDKVAAVPNEHMISMLMEGSKRQEDRLKFEIAAAEKRGADSVSAAADKTAAADKAAAAGLFDPAPEAAKQPAAATV